jgi:hypothetical protein
VNAAPHWVVSALAALTAILDAGHLAHLFTQEWLVLLAALVTFLVSLTEFLKPGAPTPLVK